MTKEEFCAALISLGHSQTSFARFLREIGAQRTEAVLLRRISTYATGKIPISDDMSALLMVLLDPQRAVRLSRIAAIPRPKGRPGRTALAARQKPVDAPWPDRP